MAKSTVTAATAATKAILWPLYSHCNTIEQPLGYHLYWRNVTPRLLERVRPWLQARACTRSVSGGESCLLLEAPLLAELIRDLELNGWPELAADMHNQEAALRAGCRRLLQLGQREQLLADTSLLGIINMTPDSFSDGGSYHDVEEAVDKALKLVDDGALMIDVGGLSTRPGASEIPPEEETARVVPFIKAFRRQCTATISVDTYRASVAAQALEAGADIINDISALELDPTMTGLLQKNPRAGVMLMHMQGTPRTMQHNPVYNDVVWDVYDYLAARVEHCRQNGIGPERIILDPGIGFGKTPEQNLRLIAHMHLLHSLGCPLLLGASRKSFINHLCPAPPTERLEGTLAAAVWAKNQRVHLLRVHDVLAHKRFLTVLDALDNQ